MSDRITEEQRLQCNYREFVGEYELCYLPIHGKCHYQHKEDDGHVFCHPLSLSRFTTKELVDELSKREGVERYRVDEYCNFVYQTSATASILVIKDD